jgi:lipid A 4'-phosphatase
MRAHEIQAWLWFGSGFLVLCGGLILLPGIDLWASGLFYRPGDGFFLGDLALFRLVHDHLNLAVWAFGIAVAIAGGASVLFRHNVLGLSSRAAIFLLLSLALGPGFTVNTIFKDHWGRARPAQIAQFGGTQKFSPDFVPSDQCRRNCSFPAGDPAMGFYLVSVALLAGSAPLRRGGVIAAVGLGAGLGVVRVAQGGHFLSDVIASLSLPSPGACTGSSWRAMPSSAGGKPFAIRHPPLSASHGSRSPASSLSSSLTNGSTFRWRARCSPSIRRRAQSSVSSRSLAKAASISCRSAYSSSGHG